MTVSTSSASRLRSIVTRRSQFPLPTSQDDPRWRASWDRLYRRYTKAMNRYVRDLLRRFGAKGDQLHEAADIVQAYWSEAMEKGWLTNRDLEIRVFRAYLQDQLRKYVISYLRKLGAQKRGGGREHRTDGLEAIPDRSRRSAEESLERGWIDVALMRAMDELGRRNPRHHEILTDLLREQNGGRASHDLGERLDSPPLRSR